MKIKIIGESRASIYSMELLIGILFLTVIIAIIFNMITISTDKITDSIDLNKQEVLTEEVLDNLIKTEGNPKNWENLNYQNSYIPGLNLDGENQESLLSYSKIRALSLNYNQIINNNILNGELKSQLIILPLNNNLNSIVMGDDPSPDASNIVVVNRSVKIDYLNTNVVSDINSNNTDYICPEGHDNNWICGSFNVYYDLNQYDYYLLSNRENFQYKLSNGITTTDLKSSPGPVKLNNDISLLNENNNSIIIVHVLKNNNDFDGLVVVTAKNSDESFIKYDYFKSQNAYIVFKTWYP